MTEKLSQILSPSIEVMKQALDKVDISIRSGRHFLFKVPSSDKTIQEVDATMQELVDYYNDHKNRSESKNDLEEIRKKIIKLDLKAEALVDNCPSLKI